MLKDLMQYLIELKRPETIEIEDRIFKLNDYSAVVEPTAAQLKTRSLKSIVDYIDNGVDSEIIKEKIIIHIKSCTQIELISEIFGQEKQRENLIQANSPVTPFAFDYFMDQEKFIIGLLSQFEMTDNLKLVISYASKIKKDESVESSDDGITQLVTAKTGVASIEKVKIPNPIELKPRRTFTEIDQSSSMFVFRVNENKGFALFQADSGAWELEAVKNIVDYYKKELEGAINSNQVVVIS